MRLKRCVSREVRFLMLLASLSAIGVIPSIPQEDLLGNFLIYVSVSSSVMGGMLKQAGYGVGQDGDGFGMFFTRL